MAQREIKFRAYRMDNKFMLDHETMVNYNWYARFGLGEKDIIWMQYTGMKDCNGKEVYEGDIVKAAYIFHGKPSNIKFHAKIIYNEYIASFQLSYLNVNNAFVNDEIYFKHQIEVVGNIYQNPDLLK